MKMENSNVLNVYIIINLCIVINLIKIYVMINVILNLFINGVGVINVMIYILGIQDATENMGVHIVGQMMN